MSRLLLLICCIIYITACHNSNQLPVGILSKEKMQVVLWDMLNAQAYTTNFAKKDSLGNMQNEDLKFQKEILSIHNISKEDFYKSYDFYKKHPELLEAVLDSMGAKAQRDRDVQFKINLKPSLHKKL